MTPFELDFKADASAPVPDTPLSRNALLLLKAIYEKTGGRSRGVRDVTELETGLTADEAKALWHILIAHRMIERFSQDYAARLSPAGLEFIQTAEIPPEPPPAPEPLAPGPSRKVYIVSASDSGARDAVAEFLTQITCESIHLHDQAAAGRTIMEQAEAHKDVAFAVVLLAPEQLGYTDGVLRPPLNVLMELGYFIGRLGRTKVSAFAIDSAIECPADLAGVALRSLDAAGSWKSSLISELQAAGIVTTV